MKLQLLPKPKYFFIFLLIIGFLFYKLSRLSTYPSIDLPSNHLKVSSVSPITSTYSSTIGTPVDGQQFRILLWTKYFGGDQWTKLKLNEWNCSSSNCLLTDDRRQLVNSDAVLFHWRDIDIKDIPQHHKSGQKWVLYNWESPHYTPEETIKPLVKEIDWTMTYRRDSDIYVPYGSIYKCDRKWKNVDLFDKKTKSVAWIVSNCMTQSNRESYVKELATHIDVDIYGYCGKHQCKRDESCFKMIENKYKFYLSLENSLCKDYVTEKLFRTLEYDIIPIVYGSGDYKHLMPNKSFININDFSSPKELSNYLKVVGSDKQKYNSYLQWKSSHCVRQTEYRYFCDLCQKLNNDFVKNTDNDRVVIDYIGSQTSSNRRRHDLMEWWYNDANCQQRNNASIRTKLEFWFNSHTIHSLLFMFHLNRYILAQTRFTFLV